MNLATAVCGICQKHFNVLFGYQVHESASGFHYYCSQTCQQQDAGAHKTLSCSHCNKPFIMEFAYQASQLNGEPVFHCSTNCRDAFQSKPAQQPSSAPKRIAVFNHKGGTAKTTTAVNLAAGLAETGQRVLLIDADGQGNVGASLGVRGEKTLYHALVTGAKLSELVVPIRPQLDILTSSELLASAELYLATQPNRHRILRDRLGAESHNYDTIVIDCAPALSLMNQNALVYATSVIVPVACDYLSLVGVKQVLRTIKNVRHNFQHPIELLGVLPTFFDSRHTVCRQALETLQGHFAERCLPPIRVNTKLRQAPIDKQTIFELAPKSSAAEDYLQLVQYIHGLQQDNGSPKQPMQAVRPGASYPKKSAPTLVGFQLSEAP